MIWVDIPTKECFDTDDEYCEAAWETLGKFDTLAKAVAFLREALGHESVTDEGWVRCVAGRERDPFYPQ